ncbi:MAG: hypothetical protein JNM80_07400 [Phycisphaerae bacterium]|nr:hypothetical protein [Phycisphaerae bacterium]
MTRWLIPVLALALLAAGCARTRPFDVPVLGERLPPELTTAVEVTNWNGSVRVEANPRLEAPEVSARVRRLVRGGPKGAELKQSAIIRAIASFDDGRRILRVTTAPASPERESDVAVVLVVSVPRSENVVVRNAGGSVELVGVGGAIDVENGMAGVRGGDVVVRTGQPLTAPVSLASPQGLVHFQAGPGSSGLFDIASDSGAAEFVSKVGNVRDAKPEPGHFRAVLNDGSNPVILRAGKGTARAWVIPNADKIGPEVWDGWPGDPFPEPKMKTLPTGSVP